MRLALVFMAVAAAAGCTLDSPGISDNDEQRDEVVLGSGTAKQIDAALSIVFAEVKNDSRCAVDVVCVWQGDATIEIGLWVGMGPTHPFTLSLNGTTPGSVTFAGYEVTFLALSPEPRSDRIIRPEEYRARFRVRPRPAP